MDLKAVCIAEMKKQLSVQQSWYPLMNEEDIVKFVFQGMLGVGHLIRSAEDAGNWLSAEMRLLEPDDSEPLAETISTDWFRLNLRPAKARGIPEEEIIRCLVRSAESGIVSFTKQDVFDFCVKLDGSDEMRTAAGKVLDEHGLPSHSQRYREAYHPAYRVLYKDFSNDLFR